MAFLLGAVAAGVIAINLLRCVVFGIVVVPPSFDDNLSFTHRVEDFAVEQFIPHSPVEAFATTVLPM